MRLSRPWRQHPRRSVRPEATAGRSLSSWFNFPAPRIGAVRSKARVTVRTGLSTTILCPGRIKVRAVWVDPPAGLSRVAGHALRLLVTAHAAVHALARGHAVLLQPVRHAIVIPAARPPVLGDTLVRMAVTAEDFSRVALRALHWRCPGLGAVPHHEVRRVIFVAGIHGAIVAVDAVRLLVARRAVRELRGGRRGVLGLPAGRGSLVRRPQRIVLGQFGYDG